MNAVLPVIGRAGHFITLEGGEGSGKSTLAQHLKASLERIGHEVVLTREPGGSEGAELIRRVLLSGAVAPLGPFAEALMFAAARDDHLEQKVRPALARGAIVISDRFADSTRAYQGVVGGVDAGIVNALERAVVGATVPDLTLVLDIDPVIGLERARRRPIAADRFEREDDTFHRRLRNAYLDIARQNPQRCVVLDAARPAEAVVADAIAAVRTRLLESRRAAS